MSVAVAVHGTREAGLIGGRTPGRERYVDRRAAGKQRMNQAAAAHGGRADVNPVQDQGFMYGRDLADPDGHLWGAFWMDPAAMPVIAD